MGTELNSKNFRETVLESKLPVIVDFWAPWCGPCRMIAPVVEAVAKEYEGRITVLKLDVDKDPDIAGQYGIMGIPTLGFFMNGTMMEKIVGLASKIEIEQAIKQNFG